MGFSEKLEKIEKNQFLPKFWWFLWFFWFFTIHLGNGKSRKIMKFQKIGRKSSFGVPIVLDHLVSENTSLSGHFDVFTTHTTVFFITVWSFGWAVKIASKCWNFDRNFTESAECLKSFREKLKELGNNLFLLFDSKFDVDYRKTQHY